MKNFQITESFQTLILEYINNYENMDSFISKLSRNDLLRVRMYNTDDIKLIYDFFLTKLNEDLDIDEFDLIYIITLFNFYKFDVDKILCFILNINQKELEYFKDHMDIIIDQIEIPKKLKLFLKNYFKFKDQIDYLKTLDMKYLYLLMRYEQTFNILNEMYIKNNQEYIQGFEYIFNGLPPLRHKIICYRGIYDVFPENEGEEFLLYKYNSCSLDKDVSMNFINKKTDKSILYKIEISPGSLVIPIFGISTLFQFEILLNKDSYICCGIINEKNDNFNSRCIYSKNKIDYKKCPRNKKLINPFWNTTLFGHKKSKKKK